MHYNTSTKPQKNGTSISLNISLSRDIVWLIGVSVGLLLLVIGRALDKPNLINAGMFVFPFFMLLGGMLEKNLWLKIVLIIIGGLFVIGAFTSLGLLTTLLS